MAIGELGVPSLCCHVENLKARASNIFSAVQAGFGNVKSSSTGTKGLAQLTVEESKSDWSGRTPLVVSFYVPTWTLLEQGPGTTVALGFQSTLHASFLHMCKLGLKLLLYETELANTDNVYLSEFLPNATGPISTGKMMEVKMGDTSLTAAAPNANIRASLSTDGKQIQDLVAHLDVSGGYRDVLAEKSTSVSTVQISPLVIAFKIGNLPAIELSYPRPVSCLRSRLRIARKSSYVEVIAPLLSPTDSDASPSWIFPTSISNHLNSDYEALPVLWHVPYLNIEELPHLDTRSTAEVSLLHSHVSFMFSNQERALREADFGLDQPKATIGRPRIDLKDGLMTMFARVLGNAQPGIERAAAFGLNMNDANGVQILIFVSRTLFDPATRTILLDAAVVPLTKKIVTGVLFDMVMRKLHSKLCVVNLIPEELKCWKSILPAFAERCRSWEHMSSSCEYIETGRVPPSAGHLDGASPLCSCGTGEIPKNFVPSLAIPQLDTFLQTCATRIAISPIFAVPYVDPCFDLPENTPSTARKENVKKPKQASTTKAPTAKDLATTTDTCTLCGS